MPHLRATTSLPRLVLAWFVLSLSVAFASPWLQQAPAFALVCGANGHPQWVAVQDSAPAELHTLDCSACLAPLLPQLPQTIAMQHRQPAQPLPGFASASRTQPQVRAPLPPRGPPRA